MAKKSSKKPEIASVNARQKPGNKTPCPPEVSLQQGIRLRVDTLLPGYIWVIPNYFSESECVQWIRYMEDSNASYTQQRSTRIMASRECYRHSFSDADVAAQLFQRLASSCPAASQLLPQLTALACNSNLRMYKYTKGMSFGKHVDGSDVVAEGVTRMTILVYLSACEGGATRFDRPDGQREVIAYPPTVGSLLLHLHGDDCLLHQADAVSNGTKYVLRTDLVYPHSRA